MGYLTLIMRPLIGLHLAVRFTRGVEDNRRTASRPRHAPHHDPVDG
jgi:hypothetical protein